MINCRILKTMSMKEGIMSTKYLCALLIFLFIGCCPPQYHKQRVSDIMEDINDNLETFQAEDMKMQVDYLKSRMRHLEEELRQDE